MNLQTAANRSRTGGALSDILSLLGLVVTLLLMGAAGFFLLFGSLKARAKASAAAEADANAAAQAENEAAAAPAPAPAEVAAAPAPEPTTETPETPADPAATSTEEPAAPGTVAVVAAPDPDQMKRGKAQFALCQACHGPDAKGLPAGPKLMAPTMHGSEIINGDPEILSLVLLKGIQKTDVEYLGMMAGLELALDDEKLADIMTYVRNSFGNKASPITTEQAAAFRAQHKDAAPVSRAQLEEMVKK